MQIAYSKWHNMLLYAQKKTKDAVYELDVIFLLNVYNMYKLYALLTKYALSPQICINIQNKICL